MKLVVSADLVMCVPLNVWKASAEYLSATRNTESWWTPASGSGALAHSWHLRRRTCSGCLESGTRLVDSIGAPGSENVSIPVTRIGDISDRGPYHADIYWNNADGTPRGPFELLKPAVSLTPSHPMLWAHDAKRERSLVVDPDSEGRIKAASGKVSPLISKQRLRRSGRQQPSPTITEIYNSILSLSSWRQRNVFALEARLGRQSSYRNQSTCTHLPCGVTQR